MGRHTAAAVPGPRRFTKIRALVASALVLGVGSTLTLAAWTDTERATATFGASVFSTESRTSVTAWSSNPTAPGATLGFAAAGMSPNTSNYAWLDVRTTAGSTVPGTVTLSAINRSGVLADALVYRAVRTAAATSCDLAAFTAGGAVFIAGDASTSLPSNSIGGSVGSPIAAAGGVLRYCFEVKLPTGATSTLQGTTGTLSWTFSAVSG